MGKPGCPVPLSGTQHCVYQLPSIPHILGNRHHKLSVAVGQEHTSSGISKVHLLKIRVGITG